MMNSGTEGTVRLDRSHARRAAEVLVRAFWNHPPLQYYFPGEVERERIAPYFFSLTVFNGIRYGEVYATSPDLEGIAVWLPSDNYPVTLWRLLRSVRLSEILGFGRNGGSRMKGLGQYIDAVHSRLAPFKHWFLQAIGVGPQYQGTGCAGRLLRQMLAGIDEAGLPCYLETLEEQNVRLYEHFGFMVAEKSAIPETDLTNWAMLRGPR
jgi:ribosomal protein S18 acetylase RimI-like enzyme